MLLNDCPKQQVFTLLINTQTPGPSGWPAKPSGASGRTFDMLRLLSEVGILGDASTCGKTYIFANLRIDFFILTVLGGLLPGHAVPAGS